MVNSCVAATKVANIIRLMTANYFLLHRSMYYVNSESIDVIGKCIVEPTEIMM